MNKKLHNLDLNTTKLPTKNFSIRTIYPRFLQLPLILLFALISSTTIFAAAITSLTTGNWSATAWPNTTRTGTITTATNSTTVTGAGTSFQTELSVGSIIKTTGNVTIGTVASIQSNTSLTLTANAVSNNPPFF